MQLNDKTEIVHSDILDDQSVMVYIEKPVNGGFNTATCFLPDYKWTDITGFTDEDIKIFMEIIESTAHLIIKFAKDGGFTDTGGR